MSNIPLSVPTLDGNEWKYIKECLDTNWVSSAGKYVELFEKKVCDFTKSKYAIACVNGTSAIHISLKLAGVKKGDEVIVPTLTFIAPINAVSYNGADPIFMDSDDFYNIDVRKTIDFVKNETIFKNGFTYNKKTHKKISAVLPVHVWGNAVGLDELIPFCKKRNISVVEDASESLGTFYTSGDYEGRDTGTIGRLGCLSFNGNKIITAGGGGMILTDDLDLAKEAKYFTTQAKDDPIKYVHNNIGFNYRLTNIQAALGVAQLELLKTKLNKKREIHNYYKSMIKEIPGLKIASTPLYSSNNYWLNILQIDNLIYKRSVSELLQKCIKNKIETRPVWMLNHEQSPYKNYQTYNINKANELVKNSICLPSSPDLTTEILDRIISVLNG
tara:strand:+ start:3743 stop:4900 length:1158 start_codon:yes stop_codon:yes gene_type:complete